MNKVKIVTTNIDNPNGYGRIVTDNGKFVRIKEHNDCSREELEIKTVNCGIYSFEVDILLKRVPEIKNDNSKGEYYLTDIIEIIKNGENIDIEMVGIPHDKQYEITGVNTVEQLNSLEKMLQSY
jgi:bifunctional UDP-N-acetylglucosamine pyrophosphorylase/glucosamine-1-phosphate N-acetyltransferase